MRYVASPSGVLPNLFKLLPLGVTCFTKAGFTCFAKAIIGKNMEKYSCLEPMPRALIFGMYM